jgi:hypothetical protein
MITMTTTITMTMPTIAEPLDDDFADAGEVSVDGLADDDGFVDVTSGFVVAEGADAFNAFNGSTIP